MRDYYAILEIPPTASEQTVREQYLFLIQAWHPDKFANPSQKAKAEEKCKEINIAYDILKDPQKRAKYDREVRGQPSSFSEDEIRRQAEAQRRKQEQERQRQQAEEAKRQADYEREERESEEAIRANFEQARWRKLRRSPVGVSQNSQEPIRILIVDDVADTRAHIRKLLRNEADIRVVGEARGGMEAIGQYEALKPDVMTTCINMPDLDGISATEAIRQKHPSAKIIILSVQNAPNYVRRCAMAGACDYLTKPPLADELLSAIRLAAGRGTQQPTVDKASPGIKPVIGIEEVIRSWKAVRAVVKPAHPAVEALLNSCKLMEVRGDTLSLGFPSETVRRLMDRPENLELARKAIADVLGVVLRIECVVRK